MTVLFQKGKYFVNSVLEEFSEGDPVSAHGMDGEAAVRQNV